MERSTGFEPVPGPWQGPVLPLYYDRPKQRNFNTVAARRQVPGLSNEWVVRVNASRGIGVLPRKIHARLGVGGHPTCSTRAVFTTGDLRCRSANLAALVRSVYTRAKRSPSL